MENTVTYFEALFGLSFQHFVFILLGAIVYILDKYQEQNLKNKLEKKTNLNFWGEYLFLPETIISFIVTMVLSIFATALAVQQMPEHPIMTAVGGGAAAYGGASILRKQMNKYAYKKNAKTLDVDNESGTTDIL